MRVIFVLVAACVLATGSSAYAQALGPGDEAPPFELQGSDGKTHRLTDYQGRTVVLAWFPKAFTGG